MLEHSNNQMFSDLMSAIGYAGLDSADGSDIPYANDASYSRLRDGSPFLIVGSWTDVRSITEYMTGLASSSENILGKLDVDRQYVLDNYYDTSVLDLVMEELGGEWAFSDEYGICDRCNTAIRYDSGEGFIADGELICFECVDDHEYIDMLEEAFDRIADTGSVGVACENTVGINTYHDRGWLKSHGFVRCLSRCDSMHSSIRSHSVTETVEDVKRFAANGMRFLLSCPSPNDPFTFEFEVWKEKGESPEMFEGTRYIDTITGTEYIVSPVLLSEWDFVDYDDTRCFCYEEALAQLKANGMFVASADTFVPFSSDSPEYAAAMSHQNAIG